MSSTVLGLDTSNYRTSVALVSETGEILLNYRKLLPVPPGERGLRQNEAVFAHLRQLSAAEDQLRRAAGGTVAAVAASTAPRDGTDSYMPVFMAGASFGRLTAAALGVPFVGTTHQRGHLSAAKAGTELENSEEYLALHLSGGTTDLLEVRGDSVRQIGGSMDLHAGQLVDRAGVALGCSFPSGPELEKLGFAVVFGRKLAYNRKKEAKELWAMRERYESRFRRDWGLYTAGSPLILTSGSLLEDTNRGKLLCQIRFRNISSRTVRSVQVAVTMRDEEGQALGGQGGKQGLRLRLDPLGGIHHQDGRVDGPEGALDL